MRRRVCGGIGATALIALACSSTESPTPAGASGTAGAGAEGGSAQAGGAQAAGGSSGATRGGSGGASGASGASGAENGGRAGGSAMGGKSAAGGATTAGSAGSSAGDAGNDGSSGEGGNTAPEGGLGPKFSDFVGLNGFIDDDKEKLAAVGNVREYHDWGFSDASATPYPDERLEFSRWEGFWDFDDYYRSLKTAGVTVFPCLQGSVEALGNRMPPIAEAADPSDPASYLAHASFLFQYAARYGSVTVPESALKLADGQVVASGLGSLRYFENGNEPDADWVNSDGSFLFEPEHTAAMSSADYDGHRGALGAGIGVKTADPEAKLVLAGLAGAGEADWVTSITKYLDGMRAWSDRERGGSFPADVLNVHLYCFGPDAFGTENPRPGISPEQCALAGQLATIARYRDEYLAGKELWLTEFGYDTHPRSRLRAPVIGAASAEVVQGQWLLRSVLALLPTGVERTFLFVSRDACTGDDTACPDNDVQFATSGVLSQKGEEAPKVAWYFLATFRARLGAMRYAGSAHSGTPDVSIARFYDADADRGAYVLWSPTSDGSEVGAYSLALAAGVSNATLVTLETDSTTGTEAVLATTDGRVAVDVTETPRIVLVDGAP